MSNFVPFNRDQAFLLPPDLRSWVPADDVVHFIVAAVEPLDAFQVLERTGGKPQYHPRLMLALLIHCYAQGIFSSRRIERATHRDVAVRFVVANLHPDTKRSRRSAGPTRRRSCRCCCWRGRPDCCGSARSRSMGSTIGLPRTVLADAGFASGRAVAALQEQGIDPLVAIGRTQPHRPYDFRPPPAGKSAPRINDPWRIAVKADDARALYKRRKQTVEPVFGIIKSAIGFARFRMRGLANVAAEWTLIALAYNCRRIVRLAAR